MILLFKYGVSASTSLKSTKAVSAAKLILILAWVTPPVAGKEGDTEADGEIEADGLLDKLAEADGLTEAEGLIDRDAEADGDTEVDGDIDGEASTQSAVLAAILSTRSSPTPILLPY